MQDADFIQDELNRAERNLAFTEVLVDSILYGSKERNMRPGLQASGQAIRDMWQKNACGGE